MYQKFSKLVLGAVTALSLLSGAAAAAEWRGWNIHVEGYPNTVAMDKFAELLVEKTGGEFTLQMFHGGTLGNQPDAIEQVRLGGLEIGNFNLGPVGPVAAAANVVSLPFIFKDVPHMFRVLEGEGGKMIAEGMAAKGLVALAWYDAGARSFYNAEKPINVPADVSGMKVRVMNNDLYSGMISQLGGNPSPMAFAEVYQALKTGVVDGAENNWPSYESTGHFEVAGYYSLSQHLIPRMPLHQQTHPRMPLHQQRCLQRVVGRVESGGDGGGYRICEVAARALGRARNREPQEGRGSRHRHQRGRGQGAFPGGDGAGLRSLSVGEPRSAAAGRVDPSDRLRLPGLAPLRPA